MTTSINPEFTTDDAPNESSWFWDEGVPGTGDKPEFLGEKYKTVAEKAKAHSELEKRLGAAPKEYDLSKGESWIDSEYGPIQDMLETAKSKHVPQEVMDKMLESVGKYISEFTVNQEDERAKLGDNADERIQLLDNWTKSNFSEDTYNALSNNLRTADAIKALEEVRLKMNANATTIPNTNHDANTTTISLQDIQSELNKNLDKYKTDPTYRREIQAKMELASKNSGYEDKRPY